MLIELDRLDQEILQLAETDDLIEHFSRVRDSAAYPEDTFQGRQAYLDTLSEAMIDAQADWHDILLFYEPTSLGLIGVEA